MSWETRENFVLSASLSFLRIDDANIWHSTVAAGKPTASKAAAGGAKATDAAGAGTSYPQAVEMLR